MWIDRFVPTGTGARPAVKGSAFRGVVRAEDVSLNPLFAAGGRLGPQLQHEAVRGKV